MKKIRILITGATGNLGFETLKILVEKYGHLAEIYAAVFNTEEAKKKIPFKDISLLHLDFINQNISFCTIWYG